MRGAVGYACRDLPNRVALERAILRVEGTPDEEIAEVLEVDPGTVARWMVRARRRIARKLPETAALLKGRRRRTGRPRARGEAQSAGEDTPTEIVGAR